MKFQTNALQVQKGATMYIVMSTPETESHVWKFLPNKFISIVTEFDNELFGADFIAPISNLSFIKDYVYPKKEFFKNAESVQMYQKAIPRFMQMVSCARANMNWPTLDAFIREQVLTGIDTVIPMDELTILIAECIIMHTEYYVPFYGFTQHGGHSPKVVPNPHLLHSLGSSPLEIVYD